MNGNTRLYARVRGMVQGVGFRFFTVREARRVGVVGYVRNRHDGGVELEVEGPEEAVSALLEAVHREPPRRSRAGGDHGAMGRTRERIGLRRAVLTGASKRREGF